MSAQCVVVDCRSGNAFSVMRALKRCGAKLKLTSVLSSIRNVGLLFLLVVGAFRLCSERLRSNGQ
jgi:imidazoleglycerol phosphate synthase glutamine amidotransferase subunit HisH